MKKILLIFLLTFSFSSYAQENVLSFIQGYGGNQDDQLATHVNSTQDGGFILSINTQSDVGTGNIDSLCSSARKRSIFLKYNADASVMEWVKCYDSEGDSAFEYLFPTNDGGAVLGGQYSGAGFLITKEDVLGNILWNYSYGVAARADIVDMIAANDGGYIMLCIVYFTDSDFTVHNSGSFNADIGVIKVDSLGKRQWSVAIGGSQEDLPFSVMPGPDNGCYIFGATTSDDYDCTGLHGAPDSAADAYLVRLDSNGNILWHHDLGGSGIDGNYGWGVSDAKGGVLLVNGSNSTDGDVHHHIGNYDYWALEIDNNNNIVWDNSYGSDTFEVPYAICRGTDGSVWMTGISGVQLGEVDTSYGGGDAWVVHADSNGNFLSGKVIGGSADAAGRMIYPLSDGGVITGGFYSGLGGDAPATYYGQNDVFLAIIAPWTTGIKNIANESLLEVYPNPVRENLIVQFRQTTPYNSAITITDEIGASVYKSNQINTVYNVIDVKAWRSGIYFVQVTSEDGYRITKKVLVQ